MTSSAFFTAMIVLAACHQCSGLGPCPDGMVEFEDKCYKFMDKKVKYDEASSLCEENGGTLATLDKAINGFISDELKRQKLGGKWWIGLHRSEPEGGWEWTDDAANDFRAWRKKQRNCAAVKHGKKSMKWLRRRCSSSAKAICAIEKHQQDEDECALNNGGCDGDCTNTVGSFTCSCLEGLKLADDGKTCNDEDECAVNNGGCDGDCTNTVGSFTCSCREGLKLADDGKSCNDEDECALNNGGCDGDCTNTVGSFTCSCLEGLKLADDGKTCNDEDECAFDNGGCEGACTNTVGSFTCSCRQGFKLADDGKSCNDEDECAVRNGGCAVECANTVGSFTCSCREGFKLTDDGKTCNDEDECAIGNGGCAGHCRNAIGSFTCSCRVGFKLADDGKTCSEDDEDTGCGSGFERHGNKCYQFILDSKLLWYAAKHDCELKGAHLVDIESAEEFTFLTGRIAFLVYSLYDWEMVWTAGKKIDDSEWFWDVEGLNYPMNYVNWYPGEPNNELGGQDAITLLYGNNQWGYNDATSYWDEAYYICEK